MEEITFCYTIFCPVEYIYMELSLEIEKEEGTCKSEDRTGMVYNPYSDKWSYL